jgi:hypothetical protein
MSDNNDHDVKNNNLPSSQGSHGDPMLSTSAATYAASGYYAD